MTVDVTVGEALETVFNISVSGFTDLNTPLNYKFLYYTS